jgi:hypothetical protein
MLFIIARAEIPDLMSQLRLMTEFISEDIQEASQGYQISDTFSLFFTTVQWISQLDSKKLSEDMRSYLGKANVEINNGEFMLNVRYDRIKIGKDGGSDRYDPFNLLQPKERREGSVCNSYIDGTQHRMSSTFLQT